MPFVKLFTEQFSLAKETLVDQYGWLTHVFHNSTTTDDYGDPVLDLTDYIETKAFITMGLITVWDVGGDYEEEELPLYAYFKKDVEQYLKVDQLIRVRLQSAGKVDWRYFTIVDKVGNYVTGPFQWKIAPYREDPGIPYPPDQGSDYA